MNHDSWRLSTSIAIITRCAVAFVGIQTSVKAEIIGCEGKYLMRRYDTEGGIRNATEGSFELAQSGEKYRIRALNPSDTIERGILVISDLKTTYQADKVRPGTGSKQSPLASKYTFAVFTNGAMPNNYEGGGAIQGLALAHLAASQLNEISAGGLLKEAYFPDLFIKRAREVRRPILNAQVEKSPATGEITIRFWATTSKAPGAFKQSESCCLVGELNISKVEKAMPLQAMLIVYSEGGTRSYDAAFRGEMSNSIKNEAFDEISYDGGMSVAVMDHRFQNKLVKYSLNPGDVPPFEGNITYSRVIGEQAQAEKTKVTKRAAGRSAAFAGGALVIFWSGAVIFRRRLAQNKTKTSEQDTIHENTKTS